MIRTIYQEAHSAISSGYIEAIQHYQVLKDNFLDQLNKTKYTTAKDFINEVMLQTSGGKVDNNSSLGQKENKIKNQLDQLKKVIVDYIKNNTNEFDQLRETIKTDINNPRAIYNDRRHALKRQAVNQEMKNTLNNEILNKKILSIMTQQQKTNEKTTSYFLGFAKAVIYEQLHNGKVELKLKDYITGILADYKEEFEKEAFKEVLKKYGMKASLTAQNTNALGQEVKYDMMFHFGKRSLNPRRNSKKIDSMINKMNTFKGTVVGQKTGSVDIDVFGAQSKSWSMPKEDIIFNQPGVVWTMQFGNYSEGMPRGEEAHYWHAGVRNAMNNIIDILGAGNVIYTFGGSQMIWTVDMLAQIRAQNLVLGYYFEKERQKITSPKVHAFGHSDI